MAEKIEIDPQKVRSLALELIEAQCVLTLATTDARRTWSAPVYYVYHDRSFFFFSSPKSRHIDQALGHGSAAGSIHAAGGDWQYIRGIQMSGAVKPSPLGARGLKALLAYLKRYPFVKEMTKMERPDSLEQFTSLFRVKMYIFQPDQILYMDNSLGFGFREEVDL